MAERLSNVPIRGEVPFVDTGCKVVCVVNSWQCNWLKIGSKSGMAKVQNRVTLPDVVLLDERAVSFIKKGYTRLSVTAGDVVAMANVFTCSVCDQVSLSELPDVSRNVQRCLARRGLAVSIALSAWRSAP